MHENSYDSMLANLTMNKMLKSAFEDKTRIIIHGNSLDMKRFL